MNASISPVEAPQSDEQGRNRVPKPGEVWHTTAPDFEGDPCTIIWADDQSVVFDRDRSARFTERVVWREHERRRAFLHRYTPSQRGPER